MTMRCSIFGTLWVLVSALSLCHSQILYSFQSSTYSVNEGELVLVTVQRNASDVDTRSIIVLLQNGTEDFRGPSQVSVFQPADLTSQVTFAAVDDVIAEPTEQFQIYLLSTTSEVVVGSQHTALITVAASDDAAGIFSFEETGRLQLSEGETIQLNISRAAGDFYSVVVKLSIKGGSDDITVSNNGSVVFSPGDRWKLVDVTVTPDDIPETEEVYIMTLSVDHPEASVVNAVRQLVILENDTPVRFTQGMYFVAEEEMQTEIILQVIRGQSELGGEVVGPVDIELTVDYLVYAHSATYNSDFLLANGTIVFNPGELVKNISTMIFADDIPELEEKFTVSLTTKDEYSLLVAPSKATVVISANDDHNGVVSLDVTEANPMYINEDQPVSSVMVTVRRDGGTFGQIQVVYNVTGDVPSTGITPTSGTVTIADGQSSATILLQAVDDVIPEVSKEYSLTLTSVSGGARLGAVIQRAIIVQDSDMAHGAVQWRSSAHSFLTSSQPRYTRWTIEREGGTIGDVAVTFICSYSFNGLVVPGTLASDRPHQVVLADGESHSTVSVQISNSSFLNVGGIFVVNIDEVKLITDTEVPSFNSPYKGAVRTDRLVVGTRNANGEIGFAALADVYVDEPDSGTNKVSIPISREGTSGTATVSWKIVAALNSPINATDVSTLSGSVVLADGSSVSNIEVEVVADDLSETAESMMVVLDDVQPSHTQRLRENFTEITVIIRENDNPGGVFHIAGDISRPILKREGESFSLAIERTGGNLVPRTVLYDISPNGNDDFFGATGLLAFGPGEMMKSIQLIVVDDASPELNETYSFFIRSNGDPPSVVGPEASVDIVILSNDSPYGQFHFLPNSVYTLFESKEGNISTVQIPVVRDAGTFGAVVVTWTVEGSSSTDLTPVSGSVEFKSGDGLAFIEVSTLPDDIPEGAEEFTIYITSVSSAAEISSPNSTTVSVVRNDAAVFFKYPAKVTVAEGGRAQLFVTRTDASAPASVSYRTVNGSAGTEDYEQVTGTLPFTFGQSEAAFDVSTIDDTTPESVEYFYVELFELKGDVVLYNSSRALIMIEANDDANGVFRFGGPYDMEVQEGDLLVLGVLRDRGTFGVVSLEWRVTANGSELASDTDFGSVSGYITFSDGQAEQNLQLMVLADGIPEYDRTYIVELFNATGDEHPLISAQYDSVTVTVLTNDDPNGVLVFSPDSLELSVAEDFLDGETNSTRAMFNIAREQGLFGDVKVLWEVYSAQIAGIMPPLTDLLFLSDAASRLQTVDSDLVYNFTGESESYANVSAECQTDWVIGNFAISVWILPQAGSNGYILSKASNTDSQLVYYSLRMSVNSTGAPLTVTFSVLDGESMELNDLEVRWDDAVEEEARELTWQHLLINVDADVAEFVINGVLVAQKIIPTRRVDNSGTLLIGYALHTTDKYTGLMRGLRLFNRKLSPVEIAETVMFPSHLDVKPISGVSYLADGQISAVFTLQSLQDVEAESNEVFSVKLISCKGGARISNENSLAKLTVLKSDNANGLFSFEGACQPFAQVNEGSILSCMVKRTRGDAGTVTLTWQIVQLINNTSVLSEGDFNSSTGQVIFYPGQLRAEIRLEALKDTLPELREYFQVLLVSVDTSDGIETTPTSGASIDVNGAKASIELLANDLPNGLLQFSSSRVPVQSNNISVAVAEPQIRVSEGIGTIAILVERAQGVIGEVGVEWTTEDATAKSMGVSNPDYVAAVGLLQFKDGQRYGSVSVDIIDDIIPEDEKHFLVKLINPTGGAALGLGSAIKVTISHSDDAYGVVQFDHASLTKLATEDDNEMNSIVLTVVRSGGLIGNTVVTWKILDDDSSDFLSQVGTVEFVDGEREASIVVTVRADVTPELDEVFHVQLINASKGRLGEKAFLRSTVTILANDDPYGVFIMSEMSRVVRVAESIAAVDLTISRTMGRSGEVVVQYQTMPTDHNSVYYPASVSRANYSDYIAAHNVSITFQPNQISQQISLLLREDNLPEPDEYFFVHLMSASLLSGGQQRPLADSPRIGTGSDVIAQVVIEANDNANGILQLSAAQVTVSEGDTTPILYVQRSAGFYGEVTVRFEVVAGNATASSDYYFTSNNVLLSDQERIKQMPIYINDDSFPEVSEVFTVRLLPLVTGGATLGDVIECVVTILESDDPHGAFEFSSSSLEVDEPDVGVRELEIAVSRLGGTMDIVAIQWIALTEAGGLAEDDIEPAFGTIYFTTNQGSQSISIGVKADFIPEIVEVITFNLTLATNGGRIGRRRLFQLSIRANNNAHGTVGFSYEQYELLEQEETSVQNVTIERSGGLFGDLLVYYSTSMINLLVLAQEMTSDYLWFFHSAIDGHASIAGNVIDRSNQADPLQACAEHCVLEKACTSFEMNQNTLICTWYSTDVLDESIRPTLSVITFYRKMNNRVSNLYKSQAQQGSDYEAIRLAFVVLAEGASTAQLPITVIADLQPELNEKFDVIIDRVQLVDGPAARPENEPTVADNAAATAVIRSNDDANGIFKIYSRDPRAQNDGQMVLVEEREHFSVELVVERTGGTIGDVSVVWSVDQTVSNASRENDYIADGATLTFLNGDVFRAITIGIEDDAIPEYDEVLAVRLSDPRGGTLIDGSRAKVSIIIQANDNVAGVVGYTSSSYIAREGDSFDVALWRSEPAAGLVTLLWTIEGVNNHVPALNFINTTGVAEFVEGQTSQVFTINVLSDDIPEVNEEYQLVIANVTTEGISGSGAAIADRQSSVASITVEASDDPHGVFSIGSSSLDLELTEEVGSEGYLVIDRKFGSIGAVRVFYNITSGHVINLMDELQEAIADEDFVTASHFIEIADGEKFGHLPLTIVDDDIPEVREVFLVNLTRVELLDVPTDTKYQPRLDVANTLTQVFIAANDGTRGQMEFPTEYLSISVNESSTVLQVSVWRAFGAYGDVSVFIYSQTSHNALLDQDYKFSARELHFQTGESLKEVNVTILDDAIPEAAEVFELVLASPEGGVTLGNHISKITILENDGAGGVVEFVENSSVTLQETFSLVGYPTSVSLQLERGPGLFGTVDIDFMVLDSAGNVTSDLLPSSGTITFVELQALAIINLNVVDDDIPEFAEYFTVELSTRFQSLLGENTKRQIVLLSSDAPNGLFSITTLNGSQTDVEEEDDSIVFCQVYRSGGLLGDVSVTVRTSPQTATSSPGSDIFVATAQVFDFEVTSFCSHGNYLLALNDTQSQLLEWDGIYRHVTYLMTVKPIKCLTYVMDDKVHFIVINSSPDNVTQVNSYVYVMTADGSIRILHTVTTKPTVDADVVIEGDSVHLAIVTVDHGTDLSRFSLDKHVITSRGIEGTEQMALSTSAIIQARSSLVVVVQTRNVELYVVTGAGWTLQQTITVMGVRDVAFGLLSDKIVLLLVVEDSLQLYRSDGFSFVKVLDFPYAGVKSAEGFQLGNGQYFIISSGNGTAILQLNSLGLQKVWYGRSLDSMFPLVAPNRTDFSVQLAKSGEVGSISFIAQLGHSDYMPRTAVLEFDEGETMKELSIPVVNDDIPEDTEYFHVVLADATDGAAIGTDNSVRIDILANDNAYGVVEFSQDSIELRATEELYDYTVPFTLVRTGGSYGRVSVMWAASADSDISSDISPTSGTVEFGGGQEMAQLSITVRADRTAERDEHISITLTRIVLSGSGLPDRGATLGEARSSLLLILANESPYGLVRWDKLTVIVAEPDGLDDITLPLSIVREQGTLGDLQISYITSRDVMSASNEQAISGQDYMSKQDRVVMAENVTRATIDVVIKADDLPEREEQFLVNITSVRLVGETNPAIEPAIKHAGDVLVVVIAENDNAGGIVQFDVTRNAEGRIDVSESAGEDTLLRLKLIREIGYFGEISVLWQVLPREASAEDISVFSGRVVFGEGEREAYIDMYIIDDDLPETIEMFDVQLISVSGGANLGSSRSVRVAILKNDSPTGLFGFRQTLLSVSESQVEAERSVSVVVERQQGYQGVVNLRWQLEANSILDFEAPHSGSLTFQPGEKLKNFTLTAMLDSVLEGEESFIVSITSVDNNADISLTNGDAVIVIQPNEGSSGHIEVVKEYRNVIVSEPNSLYDGRQVIRLTRGIGVYGDVTVTWGIMPALTSSFTHTEGQSLFTDGQGMAEVVLQTVDNAIPEERREFTFLITSATGAATIDAENYRATVVYAASDYPFGLFGFYSTAAAFISEDSSRVVVTVTRAQGLVGEVEVGYVTSSGSAQSNDDFVHQMNSLVFTAGQQAGSVSIAILQDDIAEGPETFYLNLTSATLLSPQGVNFTQVDGLQLDLPPQIGSVHVKSVVIEKNDNAEGTIEFDKASTYIYVKETDGIASLTVTRGPGTYGVVEVMYDVLPASAAVNEDFFLQPGTLSFTDGVKKNHINVTIADDGIREMPEFFRVTLTAANGGATLGSRTNAYVTINKSNYPNGKFSFLSPFERRVINPENSFALHLSIARSEGLVGNQTLSWQISGPNSMSPLESTADIAYLTDDGRETVEGQISWSDGEGGSKSFSLMIKEFTGWEIQKEFVVVIQEIESDDLDAAQNGEVDPLASSVAIIVSKNGDPNGIIQFTAASQQQQQFEELADRSFQVRYFVERLEGNLGDQEIFWEVIGGGTDLSPTSGSVLMSAGINVATISFNVLADDVPELTETFQLHLLSVVGGATIRSNGSRASFSVRFNDDPHGVFEVVGDSQSMNVNAVDLKRSLNIKISRHAGLFGSVRAVVDVTFSQGSSLFPLTRTATFADGQSEVDIIVVVDEGLFIELSSYYTVEIKEVVYLGGPQVTSPPRIRQMSPATISVPAIAANSYLYFDQQGVTVDEATHMANLRVMRIGLYGDVQIDWKQGSTADSQIPTGFSAGVLSPPNGQVLIRHGSNEITDEVKLVPAPLDGTPRVYAATLLDSLVTDAPGGARLSSLDIVVELEPYGVVGFSEHRVEVEETQGSVTLTVQRLYGSQRNIQVTYSTYSGSALAGNDFTALTSHSVVMVAGEITKEITIRLVLDPEAEQDEHFTVRLESVGILPTTDAMMSSPRLSSLYSNVTVTIRANGDPYGLLDVQITPNRVSEAEQGQVTVRVRRNAGMYGYVTVQVRTVGGGEAWDSQIALLPKTASNNTISEALSNRDSRQSAGAAADYMILNEEVVFEEGDREKELVITVLEDNLPESDEFVIVYLTDVTGGARIANGEADGQKYGYGELNIIRNDNWNGVIAYSQNSLNVTVDEDSVGMVTLTLIRTSHAQFTYDTTVQWEAVFANDPSMAANLVQTNGLVVCRSLQTSCSFQIQLDNDETPEFGYSFPVRIFNPSAGAQIDPESSVATVAVLPSDNPYGKVEFSEGLIVGDKNGGEIVVSVVRKQGTSYRISVSYETGSVDTDGMYQADRKLYSAVDGVDYNRTSGDVVFENGVVTEEIKVQLLQQYTTSSSYPRVFKVVLSEPKHGAVLGALTECTVLLVDASELDVWTTLVTASVQEMDDFTIEFLLDALLSKDFTRSNEKEMTVVENIINLIVDEGSRQLPTSIRNKLISLFCKLMNPAVGVTRGRLSLIKLFERFLFTLLVGEACESELDPYPGVSCGYFKFSVVSLLPHRLSNYLFTSSSRNSLKLGDIDLTPTSNRSCTGVQFIEYNTAHWFRSSGLELLDDKVLAVNIDGLVGESRTVTYKIFTPSGRRTDKRAQCMYYDEDVEVWSSSSSVCRVKNSLELGTSDAVECQCDHMSSYTVNTETREKIFIGYPTYLFIIAGICMLCILLSVLIYLIFPSTGLFTLKLVIHELASTFCLLGIYLLSAYLSPETSPGQILVVGEESNYKCTIIGLFMHYFLLAQFLWILTQNINLWLIFIKHDEHTERFHRYYIILGYGFPALFLAVFYGVTFSVYQQNDLNPNHIYGDVNNEQEMCFLTNQYAALAGVVAPVVVCAIGVLIFLGEIGSHSKLWRSYDDIFKNRPNRGEIWPISFLWLTTLMTCIAGGLHMAYNYNWMMIVFCICLGILSVLVICYFAILRGPCSKSKLPKSELSGLSEEQYQSTLVVHTEEPMQQVPQIQFPSPGTMGKQRGLLVPATTEQSWDHDSEDGLLNSTMIQMASSTGLDHSSSLSRRSELPADNDTRGLGELINALQGDRPQTPMTGHINSGVLYTDDDESVDTDTHQGTYDVFRRVSIADTHL